MEPHERLKWAREAAGFATITAAAAYLGLSYSTYASNESGRRGLTFKRAKRYAAAFRTSVEWLMEGKGEPPKQRERRPKPVTVEPLPRVDFPDVEEVLEDALQLIRDRLGYSGGKRSQ